MFSVVGAGRETEEDREGSGGKCVCVGGGGRSVFLAAPSLREAMFVNQYQVTSGGERNVF